MTKPYKLGVSMAGGVIRFALHKPSHGNYMREIEVDGMQDISLSSRGRGKFPLHTWGIRDQPWGKDAERLPTEWKTVENPPVRLDGLTLCGKCFKWEEAKALFNG